MPTYNCADFISSAIDSVLNQTIKNWELIIVDDCSNDNTDLVVQNYQKSNSNINYIKLRKNSGAAVARTKGIYLSHGKYVAFLDSDDLWNERKLEKQIGFMQKNDVDFSCTGYGQIDENGNVLDKVFMPPKFINYHKALFLGNPIGNLSVIYNQENLGKFDVPKIKKRNDFALWLKILRKTDYCYGLSLNLASYRIRSDSLSRNKLSVLKYHWELYRKYEHLSMIRSIYYVLCLFFNKALKKYKIR
ncbi:glycosyltransferase family 2 protein [Ligilactobacillus pobuzihii]|uniref:Glycosyl transferase group 2 n=1 Tax=Ligilactobacillus pobuzihii TaxID=449659 RepID=A0A0R2LHS8_9LACO|nr:glycosyltransferase family 2 protein [Ligilactobacillus pobuzihii]KRK09305.1 glycosyl transferase group 2 [Ligilactobacillus pobuzihii E100301 = KCTC 13174]KRO01317.1 glycosyl transferase group 2 [Ligilactobacillus pobuzihii]GEN49050.1 glycosyl transferase [Ligilactobacillus pobuzihii]